MEKINVAIVGATGMVGSKILEVLKERQVPIGELFCFSSARSSGSKINFAGREVIVEELKEDSFKGKNIDIGLFSAGGQISKDFIPLAIEEGIYVVDNSSTFRMDPEVPLIVPEVNGQDFTREDKLISNPNCSTIQSVMAIKPIYEKYGIKRIVYNTYQAVSGSGVKGVKDLQNNTTENYPYSIRNNCLPHIDSFLPSGYTKEEVKMIDETRKILGDDDLRITATTVRVPIENSHSVSINLELENDFELEDIRNLISNFPGLILQDDVENNIYPLAENANDRDEVLVGRIRRDESVENGLNLWCVADNIRKGAATNTVQIAQLLIEKLGEE